MFERKKPRYCSRGVAEEIPMELQIFLWSALEQQRELHDMDYLQIFQLQVEEAGTLSIHYSQEQPEYEQVYVLVGVGADMPEVNGTKLYVIDDETHITMVFPEER
ncbi:MAG: DUF960 domain-containing protein [Firmicutes bacterium]|nr:DUF960 domain-containing protein [Bacillota bacterium]